MDQVLHLVPIKNPRCLISQNSLVLFVWYVCDDFMLRILQDFTLRKHKFIFVNKHLFVFCRGLSTSSTSKTEAYGKKIFHFSPAIGAVSSCCSSFLWSVYKLKRVCILHTLVIFLVEMSNDGCIHLKNFKSVKGVKPYKLIHAYFVSCTSAEARRRKVGCKHAL